MLDSPLVEGASSNWVARTVWRSAVLELARLGRREDALALWQSAAHGDADDLKWLAGEASAAMAAKDLAPAGEYAQLLAKLRWAPDSQPRHAAPVYLSVAKLRHDIDQFRHLAERGRVGKYETVIAAYEHVAERLEVQGVTGRVALDAAARRSVGHVYSRLVNVRDTPRLSRALSDRWDPSRVEERFLEPPGVAVVDDLLTPEALASLYQFCLESTVWWSNRYTHGRLGAFFHDGFGSPLLLQIAEELRAALPRVIGDRYPLRQLWGFKNGQEVRPADVTAHADFAAVNVNFWVTPTEANLDPSSGGLIVHNQDAPTDWDFHTYNGKPEVIDAYLRRQSSTAVTIPYRQNRAIIFNSDLFHGTAAMHFRPGYANRRINITLLYGDRADDVHHRRLGVSTAAPVSGSAWRSGAFTRAR